MPSPGHRLLTMWRRLSPLPGGRWAFGWVLGRMVPYSASVKPQILELEPGHARIALHDRRRVRNHLSSVHAIALANVAELASGLAMTTALPAEVRAIVVRICVEYLKKARGTLIAESRCALSPITTEEERDFLTEVRDSAGDVVARATVTWRLRPGQAS